MKRKLFFLACAVAFMAACVLGPGVYAQDRPMTVEKAVAVLQDPEAPAPEEKKEEPKRQEVPVIVRMTPVRKLFVGDEPIQVTYYVFYTRGVRFSEEAFRQAMPPFTVTSVAVGSKVAVPKVKDVEYFPITVTLRLPAKNPCGKYRIPPFKVAYEFDEVTLDAKTVRKRSVVSGSAQTEKVPFMVDVDPDHDVGFIGDALRVRMIIRAQAGAEILNEHAPQEPKKGISYLSKFKPEKPFVLLETERAESVQAAYRIVRWTYVVAAHDIEAKPFKLALPSVIWRMVPQAADGKIVETATIYLQKSGPNVSLVGVDAQGSSGDVKTVLVDPVSITVRSILKDTTALRPPKQDQADPAYAHERYYAIPVAIAYVLSAGLALWVFIAIVRFLKGRKSRIRKSSAVTTQALEAPEPVFATGYLSRWRLQWATRKAKQAFIAHPDEETCGAYRSCLARLAVSGLKRNARIDTFQACAMTARELEKAVGATPLTALINTLDEMLETNTYENK